MELMVSVGISGIVSLVGASLMALAISYFRISTEKYETESDIASASFALKTNLSQAVDVRYFNGCPTTNLNVNALGVGAPTAGGGNFRGGVVFECDTSLSVFPGTTGTAQPLTYLAIFPKEMALGDQISSQLGMTSISFARPRGNRSGTLIIRNKAFQDFAGNTSIAPLDGSDVRFGHLTKVRMMNMSVVTPESSQASLQNPDSGLVVPAIGETAKDGWMLASVDVEMTFRFFTHGHPETWCWEPADRGNLPPVDPYQGGECVNLPLPRPSFRDYKRVIRVTFRNNSIYLRDVRATADRRQAFDELYPWSTAGSAPVPSLENQKRLLGRMYFFGVTSPKSLNPNP